MGFYFNTTPFPPLLIFRPVHAVSAANPDIPLDSTLFLGTHPKNAAPLGCTSCAVLINNTFTPTTNHPHSRHGYWPVQHLYNIYEYSSSSYTQHFRSHLIPARRMQGFFLVGSVEYGCEMENANYPWDTTTSKTRGEFAVYYSYMFPPRNLCISNLRCGEVLIIFFEI